MAALGVVLLGYGVSPPADLQAVQAPRMSLDMVVSDNAYDDSTNAMTVGSVDNCLTADPGNNAQHTHTAHLVIQDVEDLVGWQARMNYNGGRMRPSTVNFVPFSDNTTGQSISFVNLPLDGAFHRDLVTAASIPPQAAGFQTALVGAVYNGAQNIAVSPDTPAKGTPDDSSYSAPSGGVLAAVNVQVLAGQAGLAGLYVDLDDANPNGPGSDLVIFTGSGTSSINVVESALGDGFHGEGVPCLPVTIPPLPSAPTTPAPGQGVAPSSHAGDPHCATDPSANTYVDTADIAQFTGAFGTNDPWLDIAPMPMGSGFVDTADIAEVTGVFGSRCIGNWQPQDTSTASDASDPIAAAGLTNCRFATFGYIAGYNSASDYFWVGGPTYPGGPDEPWGGTSGCYASPGIYLPYCSFQWRALYGQEWEIVAATMPSDKPGYRNDAVLCDSIEPGAVALPCNVQLMGYMYHYVRNDFGSYIHGPHVHSEGEYGSFGYNVPC